MESKLNAFDNIMVITDLDGTFFNGNGVPAPQNIGPIEEFTAAGGLFTVATGRMHNVLPQIIPGALDIINAPVISCNGVALYDIHQNKPIFEYSIDGALARDVMRDLHSKFEFRHCVHASDNYIPYDHHVPIDDIPSNIWKKAVLLADPDVCDNIHKYLLEHYGDTFSYNMSCPVLFEILPAGANKGVMIDKMRSFYKAQGRDIKIFAIGDYENDIEMLKAADVAACPENSLDTVKEICDYVLCSNNDGCVAELIKIAEDTVR